MCCNAYVLSCFRYCDLVWMFCSKGDSIKIESTHIRALRTVTLDFVTPKEKVLETYNAVSIHKTNLNFLATEVYKSIFQLNPSFMWDFFVLKSAVYNMRHGPLLQLPMRSECTKNSFVFRAVLLWNNLPADLKNCPNLGLFKSRIKTLDNCYCLCRSCSI